MPTLSSSIIEAAKQIKVLFLDVDGVLSNGQIIYADDGRELKTFSTFDGLGIKLLQQQGIEVAIVTGRSSAIVERRAKELGIENVVQGREDKLVAVHELLSKLNLDLNQAAYVGDDLPDLSAIMACGIGFAVANAHQAVKERANIITSLKGGEGAVREACEIILMAIGKYDNIIEQYSLCN